MLTNQHNADNIPPTFHRVSLTNGDGFCTAQLLPLITYALILLCLKSTELIGKNVM